MRAMLEELKRESGEAHRLMDNMDGDHDRWLEAEGESRLLGCVNAIVPKYVELIQGIMERYVYILEKPDIRERETGGKRLPGFVRGSQA